MTYTAPLRSSLSLLVSLPLVSVPAFSQVVGPAIAAAPPSQVLSSAPKPASPTVQSNYGKLPLSFETNQGQSDPQVKFLARGSGYSLFLTDTAAVLALTKGDPSSKRSGPIPAKGKASRPENPKTDVVRMELAGANPASHVSGADQLPGTANYFIGNDPTKWHSNVLTYARVKYTSVYPGVDLVYYGNQQQLEYDFVVAPQANPKPVRLHFAGAERLKLNADGDLTIIAKDGEIAFHRPVIYQTKDGQRQPVEGQFTLLAGNSVGFRLGAYDHGQELVIDPVLVYSTYLGGSVTDFATAIAVDSSDNGYITGLATSPDFPSTLNSFQPNGPLNDEQVVFVTKINSAGSALIYSTFLGETDYGGPLAIQVDGAGCAYVAGDTDYNNFPTTAGAFQTAIKKGRFGSGYNAFVTKLNSQGSTLIYSTFLGGTTDDTAIGLAVDAAGHAFVAGTTEDSDFPVTPGAFDTNIHTTDSEGRGFLTEFNSTGSALVYSTYFGGSAMNYMTVAVDALDHAYVTGSASPNAFPRTSGVFQFNAKTSSYTGFVSEFNPAGSALVYSTFLGGSGADFPMAIALDPEGNAYVTGRTSSTDFPTTSGAFQPATASENVTSFVTKLNPKGTGLVYSTYLGGTGDDRAIGIALDGAGRAFVTGSTSSTDFPVTPDAYVAKYPGSNVPNTAFFTELESTGAGLAYSTYFGGSQNLRLGSHADSASGVAVDALGNAYVAGAAASQDFPITAGAFQPKKHATFVGSRNAFISKFAFNGATTTNVTSNDSPRTEGENVSFTAHVSPASGSDVPTGTVAFIVDGLTKEKVPLDGSGDALFGTSDLEVGSHAITASYLSDPAKYSSSDGVLTQTIVASLGSKLSAPTFVPLGGAYSSPASVKLETASPGATIRYTTDNSTPTSSSPKYTGPISVSKTTTIKAIAVETGYVPSAGAAATYTIQSRPGTIEAVYLTLSSYLVSAGEPVTFSATILSACNCAIIPTGSVTFKHGSTTIGTAPLVKGKTLASFTTSGLAPNGYQITAVYTGDANYPESPSQAINLIVAH